jgi:hypothetical protein
MHDALFYYIEEKAGEKLTDHERASIKAAFDRKSMRKRQYFIQEGHPEFLERFPMNMIASYLGLLPETLSRIRKNALMPRRK